MSDRVLIDARAAVRSRGGGVERFAREITAGLRATDPDRYAVLTPRSRLAHRAGHVWEQTVLPRRAGGRIILAPANTGPIAASRLAVVIHDLAVLRVPEAYSRGYRLAHLGLLRALLRRAEQLITVSEFSRGELAGLTGADPARIAVVPCGVGAAFSPRADAAQAARALGLTREYVLLVATPSARKGLDTVGELAQALSATGMDLVLAGGTRGYLRAELPAGVRRLGFVPERWLPGLYAGARALVMPSRYEGFGLPCLEAMACGVPVVCTDAGALRELCGDAALPVPVGDAAALADAVRTAIADAQVRERLVARGLRRAADRTWAHSTAAMDRVLRNMAGLAT